jgi:hypothetical protein
LLATGTTLQAAYIFRWRCSTSLQTDCQGDQARGGSYAAGPAACIPHLELQTLNPRRIKGMPARLSAAEVARYRSSMAGAAALVGHVPRLALGGRNRYGLAAAAAQVWPRV